MSRRTRLWVVWATRDARRRWLQVVSIALLIALGTGMYSAMSSMSRWRVASADASYARLRVHDLRVTLAESSYAPAGSLARAVTSIPARDAVRSAAERLVVPTQVDASQRGKTIIVAGRIVGASGGNVDRTAVDRGRALTRADAARPVAELERNFAAHYGLAPRGTLHLSGGQRVAYVGQVYAPEYFIVTAPGADFGAESSFAVLFTSLATAQRLAGVPGRVNQLVLRVAPRRIGAVEAQLGSALRKQLPRTGFTFTRLQQEPAHRLIYEDAKNDQQMLDIFALLLLGAAAFAAFNLISRVVEAQRREIGIGMALGVRPARLAARPLLLGFEIALLGAVLGIGVGLIAKGWMAGLLETWFPLPVRNTPFEADLFATGAVLGLLLPLLATALPVWRAVRVPPIEAIRVGARAAGSSGLAWLAKGLRMPGGSLASMPVRNVLRTPRRTGLTLLGIGGVVAIVVAMSGLIDSFGTTLDAARNEALAGSPQRTTVDLLAPQPANSRVVRSIRAAPGVRSTQVELKVPVSLRSPADHFDAFLEVGNARARSAPGVVLAKVAAKDLGVGIGDYVSMRHPVPTGGGSFALKRSRVRVVGIHGSPFRFVVYGSPQLATKLGLGGIVNRVSLVPRATTSSDALKRTLMQVPGVAAVQSATAATDAVDQRMAQFNEVLVMTVAIALLMALLMAYNASAINADERARENATMFAFGVPLRRVLSLGVEEALLIGLLATAIGGAVGYGLLRWLAYGSMPDTMPDVGMLISVSPMTVVFALVAGTLAVALAPLFTRRRLARTDIPSTLRVVE